MNITGEDQELRRRELARWRAGDHRAAPPATGSPLVSGKARAGRSLAEADGLPSADWLEAALMPISPANMALYPGGSIKSPEWLAIRAFVQARAGGRCEQCGVKNYSLGGRTKDGRWVPATPKGERLLSLEWPKPGEYSWCTDGTYAGNLRIVRIVCTVAHVDQGLTDHSADNLRFWCQRCHNRHDHASRRQNSRRTIAAKSGQAELL